jgi:hypothetical protein
MDDVRRYRMNAAECFSAAQRYEPAYRGLTLAIAATWTSLARRQKTMDKFLAIWSKAAAGADTSRQRFRYPPHLRRPKFSASSRFRYPVPGTDHAAVPRVRLADALFAAAALRAQT